MRERIRQRIFYTKKQLFKPSHNSTVAELPGDLDLSQEANNNPNNLSPCDPPTQIENFEEAKNLHDSSSESSSGMGEIINQTLNETSASTISPRNHKFNKK